MGLNGLANMAVGAVLGTCWDFCDNTTTSGDCREQSQKEKIASVCCSCVEKNTLMMSEVRREWPDWLEATERQHKQPVTTKTCVKATLPTLPHPLSPAIFIKEPCTGEVLLIKWPSSAYQCTSGRFLQRKQRLC